jgi:A/G-specific adenine glycosylase
VTRRSLTDAPALPKVRSVLLAWYSAEHRDFPWRRTSDPYAVLVSEVMLQQTQASRVALRYPAFMERFPSVEALADATESAVLAAWSGLGYNRRALALRRAAGTVVTTGWPRDIATLEGMPGIGPYTARALLSLAFGEPVGVVDTNVRRWLIRRFGLAPATPSRELQRLADGLARAGDAADAAAWTHASMEFGAAICASRSPRCQACPVAEGCPSRAKPGRVTVPRQARFAGSDRARRGAILRALTRARGHSMGLAAARKLCPGPDFERIVCRLEGDRLAHRSGARLRLGGPPEPAATIGI